MLREGLEGKKCTKTFLRKAIIKLENCLANDVCLLKSVSRVTYLQVIEISVTECSNL